MEYKIVEKAPFTVVGVSATFKYDNADKEISKFWATFNQAGKHSLISSMYGISIDKDMGGNDYAEGIEDKNYYSELWIPVRKK